MKVFALQQLKSVGGDYETNYLAIDGSRTGEALRCSICGKFLGMLPLRPPVRVELESCGSRWGDVAFGPGDQILVSGKLKKLFTEAGLVGFVRIDPVEVVK